MQDLIFVTCMVAFFALAAVLVRACERIIGAEDLATVNRTLDPPAAREDAAA